LRILADPVAPKEIRLPLVPTFRIDLQNRIIPSRSSLLLADLA
jgi:hypothetical protein